TQVAVGTATAATAGTAATAASATAAVSASSPAAAASAGADARGAPWLQGRDLRAEFTLGADGRLRQLRADAGRLQLAGGLGVRWDEIVYGGPGGALQLRATVDSFRAAPLLARWQPDLGWDGDLEVGARLELNAAERFDAELVVERERGDLRVLVPGSEPLALGLTDLRLALSAHDGTWYFTQALAGRALGEVGGALRVRTAATRRWPAPDDPLDGTLQARVANLDVWGAWIPAGWRLQGELTTTASFGGRFGAPEVTGVLEGRGLGVRNLLEGVAVRDGEVRVRLAGETARIERFVAHAGEGQLTVSGGATLGADPQARLTLQAERFQVLGRIDRRVIASGNADLTLSRSKIGLDGRFQVDEGLFDLTHSGAPTLDADVVVVRRGDRAAEFDVTARRAPPPPDRDIDVAVQVDLGDALRVRGRGIDTLLTGRLRVTAPKGSSPSTARCAPWVAPMPPTARSWSSSAGS
ncbi:MAG: translocation/assembly module TamB domain-containing protein, partial [Rubrivivax sp.]